MRKILIAALFLILSAGASTSHATNILTNSGFETGDFSSWTLNLAPVITNTEAHTGSYSVAAMAGDRVTQYFNAVSVSSISEVSYWGKRQGGLFDSIQFFYSDGSIGSTLADTIGYGDNWTFVDVTSFLDAGKSLIGFGVYGTTPGPAYLDDFAVITTSSAVPEPSTMALLGLGLAGFGFYGKRRKNNTA